MSEYLALATDAFRTASGRILCRTPFRLCVVLTKESMRDAERMPRANPFASRHPGRAAWWLGGVLS